MDKRQRIMRAIKRGNLEIIKKCSIKTAGTNDNILLGDSLSEAAYFGHLNIVKYLVNIGANVRHEFSDCLGSAAMTGQTEIFHFLLSQGADMFEAENHKKANPKLYIKTPLFWACHSGCLELARFMIDSGCDLSINNFEALDEAVDYANIRENYQYQTATDIFEFFVKDVLSDEDFNLMENHWTKGRIGLWFDRNQENIRLYRKRKSASDRLEVMLSKKSDTQKARAAKI